MLAGEGLRPSKHGKRVRFSGAQRKVVDGPFAETKELVAGFWLWQVKSMEEAVEWVKRAQPPCRQRGGDRDPPALRGGRLRGGRPNGRAPEEGARAPRGDRVSPGRGYDPRVSARRIHCGARQLSPETPSVRASLARRHRAAQKWLARNPVEDTGTRPTGGARREGAKRGDGSCRSAVGREARDQGREASARPRWRPAVVKPGVAEHGSYRSCRGGSGYGTSGPRQEEARRSDSA